MGIVISALVTFWVGFLIYKKYKPQPVLFLGGMILMYIAVLFPAQSCRKKHLPVPGSSTHLNLCAKP